MLTKYGKSFAAVVAAALTAAHAALFDQHIDAEEWVRIAIAATTAVGVYLVPLAPQYRWGKTAVAMLLSALQVLVTVILDGVDSGEWIAIALAALTAAGVIVTPAVSGNGVSVGRSATDAGGLDE